MLCARFELEKLLGQGSYGKVYRAFDTLSNQVVSLKVEAAVVPTSTLASEARVMSLLTTARCPLGFAQYHHFAQEGCYQVLAMEVLGKSLGELLRDSGGRLTPTTTVLVAQQMLQRIEYLHSRGLVHKDVKPDNFVLGLGPRCHVLHLIDFGCATEYYGSGHVRLRRQRTLVGTIRYFSRHAHEGLVQSRRDDLESLGYVLVFLRCGALPWSSLKGDTAARTFDLVGECKRATSTAQLCRDCPGALASYLQHCRSLGFAERPDYMYLRCLFRSLREDLASERGSPIQDHDFQWNADRQLPALDPVYLAECYRQPEDRRGGRRKRELLLGCISSMGQDSKPRPGRVLPEGGTKPGQTEILEHHLKRAHGVPVGKVGGP